MVLASRGETFLENRYTNAGDRRARIGTNLQIKLNNPVLYIFPHLFNIWFQRNSLYNFFSPELITVYTRSMLNLPIFPTILHMKTKLYYKKCYLPPTNSSLGELLKIQMTSQPLKIWTHLGLKWGPDISIFQRVPRWSNYEGPATKTRILIKICKI